MRCWRDDGSGQQGRRANGTAGEAEWLKVHRQHHVAIKNCRQKQCEPENRAPVTAAEARAAHARAQQQKKRQKREQPQKYANRRAAEKPGAGDCAAQQRLTAPAGSGKQQKLNAVRKKKIVDTKRSVLPKGPKRRHWPQRVPRKSAEKIPSPREGQESPGRDKENK